MAWWIERTFREHGAEALAFASIVAAGANGASPHASPGQSVIEEGTLVTVDMGCVVDGYCSDCTRTFATGPLSSQLTEIYGARGPGAAGRARRGAGRRDRASTSTPRRGRRSPRRGSPTRTATGSATASGWRSTRRRRCAPSRRTRSAAGNVVTVEPGLYLPGVGGCRIEDLVVVTEDGCEILTSFTKELLTLP